MLEKKYYKNGKEKDSWCNSPSNCELNCTLSECSHVAFQKILIKSFLETKATNKIKGAYSLMKTVLYNGDNYFLINKIKKHTVIIKEKGFINSDFSITKKGLIFISSDDSN